MTRREQVELRGQLHDIDVDLCRIPWGLWEVGEVIKLTQKLTHLVEKILNEQKVLDKPETL